MSPHAMSPHALHPHAQLPPQPHSPQTPSDDWHALAKFAITPNGFLPDQPPLKTLPDPYYGPWESLMLDLHAALEDQTLRPRVRQLPVLSVDRLATTSEWRRAYLVLIFFAHAYIWGGDRAAEVLPPSISVPLLRVAAHLELPPVATYAGLNLWNYSSTSSDLTDLDALATLHTFTGTEDESWFFLVSVAVEARGARVIPILLRGLEAAAARDFSAAVRALDDMAHCTRALGRLLDRMYERCDPSVFYHRIRPFLAGSQNMAAAGLPHGVLYDEGDGRGEWRRLRGGSNGQSSLIQFLDVVLGVRHTSDGGDTAGKTSGEPGFHQEVRGYMPGPHRRFLERVESMGSMADLARLPAAETGATPEQHESFRLALREATRALAEFRGKHLQMVTRYIVIPSRQPPPGKAGAEAGTRINLASAAPSDTKTGSGELTGTGGTALLPFLKQARDETYRAGEFPRDP